MSGWGKNGSPPNYSLEYEKRAKRLRAIRADAILRVGVKEYYKHPDRAADFMDHWAVTYDPRNQTGPTKMPFVLFERQREFVGFLNALLEANAGGLVEKSRDMGATWLCSAYSVWLWLYSDGASVGWGSRKEQLVDKIGDPDSIFEKMRIIIRNLPREMWPARFDDRTDMPFMRIVNPETGATITGEAGDNIGRGGRKLIYFLDEAAHVERPEKVEAALGDNTNIQVALSSVNGTGNLFQRRREVGVEWEPGQAAIPGKTNVFIMDWRDHPAKSQAWYDQRKAKFDEEGLAHVFAQEVDRNYSASVEGIIIMPEWVEAAIDAHVKLGFTDDGPWLAAMDVADEGLDKNACAARKGVVLRKAAEWGSRDPGEAVRHALMMLDGLGPMEFHYDSIGVGAGVKAEANRLKTDKLWPKTIKLVPWNAAASPINPLGRVIEGDSESLKNEDYYGNLKAQGWRELALRFWRTFQAVTQGVKHPSDKLISISTEIPQHLLRKLRKELSQPVMTKSTKLKLIVDKTPTGTASPNMGDTVMMAYWPARSGATGFLDLLEGEKKAMDTRKQAAEKPEEPAPPAKPITGPSGWKL